MNEINKHSSFWLVIAALVVFGVAGPAGAQQDLGDIGPKALANKINAIFRSAVAEVTPAVVFIHVTSNNVLAGQNKDPVQGAGSGFIIDGRGYIVTNNHIVAGKNHVVVVLADEREFVAQDVFVDEDSEIAVVRIDPAGQELPVARFGDSEQSQVGDVVFAIGNPFGYRLRQTVTSGVISHKGRQTRILDRNWGYEDFIQTDADINRGNSGGPLVNLRGEVIGVNTMIISDTGVSAGLAFAVPSNIAKFVVDGIIANKMVRRGYLGVIMNSDLILDDLRKRPLDKLAIVDKKLAALVEKLPDSIQGGLIVTVLADTPASDAGLEDYDIVLKLAGREIESSRELHTFTATLAAGATVPCVVWRDGREIELQITPGDRDEAKARHLERHRAVSAAREIVPRLGAPKASRPLARQSGLGIRAIELSGKVAVEFGYDPTTKGVVVDAIRAGSLADQNGLCPGDIIVSINGTKIETSDQLVRIMSKVDLVGKGIEMTVRSTSGPRSLFIGGSAP